MILLEGVSGMVSMGLWLTYGLIALALLGMVIGIVIAIIQNMKEGGMVALISLVALIVLYVIGYSMSSKVVPEGLQQFVGASGYKLSSGGLITFYIMAAVASILMVVGLVKGMINGN